MWVNISGDLKILNEGESVEGYLIDKYSSNKYPGRFIYKIKDKDSNNVFVIIGSTVLDRRMFNIPVNSLVCITREKDTVNRLGRRVKMFNVKVCED